jgi:hypothetical protein
MHGAKRQLNTYAGYSAACAGVWAAILVVARRRVDDETWKTLRLVSGGWWSGWTSATIARAGYPAPSPLTPGAKQRLERASLGLVALGLGNVVRVLVRGHARTSATGIG